MQRKTRLSHILILGLGLALLVLPQIPGYSTASSQNEEPAKWITLGHEGLQNYDIRLNSSAGAKEAAVRVAQSVRAQAVAQAGGRSLKAGRIIAQDDSELRAEMSKAEARLARKLPGLQVTYGEGSGLTEVVEVKGGRRQTLTRASREKPEKILRRFVTENAPLYGLTRAQVSELKTSAAYTNPSGNLEWVILEQEIDGIPVFQGELKAAFTRSGELVRTVSTLATGIEIEGKPRLKASKQDLSFKRAEIKIGAAEAVARAAASIGVAVDASELAVIESSADGSSYTFAPGPFADKIKVDQVYFSLKGGVTLLAWSMILWQDNPAYYTLVEAEEGELLWRKNITNDQTQSATYSVYDNDSPGPLSPTNATPGSGIQGAGIGRTLFTLISEGPAFNNLGWITDGGTTTTGNNVDAGLDLVTPNGIDPGSRPVSATRTFNFPYNPPPLGADVPTGASYRLGEVTNMFFWVNRYHDRLYQLGFTEPARNFQTNNFGRGGLGNDHVLAEAQDFSGTDNANFSTGPDGTSGRMQMFIFTGPTPDRTSGIDQEILIHELTHGLSNRLHGNATGLGTTMAGGMGEGWSDFYALSLLSQPGDDPNGVYAVGGYSTLQIVSGFTDNYYYGIRRFPRAVRSNTGPNGKPHDPLTFADIDGTQINLTDGAFPRGPIGAGAAFQVHNIGEVWSGALWEVRARIIGRLGHAAGNQRALQIVTDGMKLDPINPTLLQARDAILQADCAGFSGEDEMDIWAGFAARGMGFSARVISAATGSVVEAFDLPNLTLGTVVAGEATGCDNSPFADPGETVNFTIPLTNPFCATTANNTTASITGGGSANYGNISPGQTVSRDISFTVPTSTPCGSLLTIQVDVTSSLGTITKTFTLQVGAPTGLLAAANYSSGNTSIPIPDLGTVDVPINVSDSGIVGDVNVKVRLNHTFDGDLILRLIAPDGTSVTLASQRGGLGDNYGTGANDCSGTSTVFDDASATLISAGIAPFAGTFRPEAPLTAMNGRQMNGTWILRVSDNAGLDVGTVGCAQIEIRRQLFFCCGVAGDPLIEADPPATLVEECFVPANGAPDPGERVTMSFTLQNIGSGLTTNLVATLLPGGGVSDPSGPQSYGVLSPVGPGASREFSFIANGACGSDITATCSLDDVGGAGSLGTVTFTIRLGAIQVGNTTVANATTIVVPGAGTGAITGAPSNPYPSTINVSGITGTVTKVTATLTGFSHTFPGDVDILLAGPQGQKIILMSDVGSGTDALNTTLTFDDAGPVIGATVVSGTFRPTNIGTGDPFPAPAPVAPFGSTLSSFNGVDPNGAWNLFVVDDAGLDTGSIAGGWSLTIITADPVCVVDNDTPVLASNVDTTQIGQNNHDLVNVGFTASPVDGTDSCVVLSVAVFADEDDEGGQGDGNHSPDARNIASGTLRLRAERNGGGDGRVYLIIVTATDSTGKFGRRVHTVTVPHSNSPASKASVASQAAAAAAFGQANGTAPPGFFVVGDGPVAGPKQ